MAGVMLAPAVVLVGPVLKLIADAAPAVILNALLVAAVAAGVVVSVAVSL